MFFFVLNWKFQGIVGEEKIDDRDFRCVVISKIILKDFFVWK